MAFCLSSEMKIVVLGHRGMLGHVVSRYLTESGYRVKTIEGRFEDSNQAMHFVEKINDLDADWCINCIGIRSGKGVSNKHLTLINHHFPILCSRLLHHNCSLIHASTDAVFSLDSGACLWDRKPTATDPYGASKLAAEAGLTRSNDFVIRSSIIGPERGEARNLLAWFLKQSGSVKGFCNVNWNGITTLEWAKKCCRIIESPFQNLRIIQPACHEIISKGELLILINECWNASCKVKLVESPIEVSRWLVPNCPTLDLNIQLANLRKWYYSERFF